MSLGCAQLENNALWLFTIYWIGTSGVHLDELLLIGNCFYPLAEASWKTPPQPGIAFRTWRRCQTLPRSGVGSAWPSCTHSPRPQSSTPRGKYRVQNRCILALTFFLFVYTYMHCVYTRKGYISTTLTLIIYIYIQP